MIYILYFKQDGDSFPWRSASQARKLIVQAVDSEKRLAAAVVIPGSSIPQIWLKVPSLFSSFSDFWWGKTWNLSPLIGVGRTMAD